MGHYESQYDKIDYGELKTTTSTDDIIFSPSQSSNTIELDAIKPGMRTTDVIETLMDRVEKLEERIKNLEANKILLEEDYE